METEIKQESIKSFQSTIKKTEKALEQMTEKKANTTLIKKRLNAFHIGLAVLEKAWNNQPHPYNSKDLEEARNTLIGLLPSIQSIYEKSKEGSPQKTLLERRITSMELAIEEIEKTV